MAKFTVSPEFKKFAAKNQDKFNEAIAAEKQVRGSGLPVGTIGTAIISDGEAKTTDKGVPYCKLIATVVEPEEYAGRTFWCAYQQFSADAKGNTPEMKVAWFLDRCENLGLEREAREQMDAPYEALEILINEPHYISFEVKPPRGDFEQFDCVGTVAPDSVTNEEAAEVVSYLGRKHRVLSVNGDTMELVEIATGKKREVESSELDD